MIVVIAQGGHHCPSCLKGGGETWNTKGDVQTGQR